MRPPTMTVMVSAETLEADLREELDRLDQTVTAALAAFRRSPGTDVANALDLAARQQCALGNDLATVLGDDRLRRQWRPIEGIEHWSPRLRVGVGQKPLIPTPWRDQIDALRRLRAPSS